MERELHRRTPEQEMADKYQARLEEVKKAVAEEIEVLKALEKPLSSYKDEETESAEYMEAGQALFTLLGWLKESTIFPLMKAKTLEHVSAVTPDLKKEIGSQGLPEIAIPVLVWPKEEWFDEDNNLGLDDSVAGNAYNAYFLPPSIFEESKTENPMSVTGVILTNKNNLKFNAVHETMHFLDFNQPLRVGAARILGEVIAFRQQDRIRRKEKRGNWDEQFKKQWEMYYGKFHMSEYMTFDGFKGRVLEIMAAIKRLDNLIDETTVTHILLNSLTLDDIAQWDKVSDEDLNDMIKNKYE